MHSPAESVLRIGKSLAVHIVIGVLLYALAVFLLGNFDAASDTLREQYEETEVMQLLASTRSTLISWYVIALVISWACSAIFLIVANLKRKSVRIASDGRKALPIWIILFLVSIALTTFVWWREVSLGDVASMLLDGNYLALVTAGQVGTALAFWLGTGLAVALTLKPSVPLAQTLLPNMWN